MVIKLSDNARFLLDKANEYRWDAMDFRNNGDETRAIAYRSTSICYDATLDLLIENEMNPNKTLQDLAVELRRRETALLALSESENKDEIMRFRWKISSTIFGVLARLFEGE